MDPILKGKVISGLHEGKKFMSIHQYEIQFHKILNAKPFAGTLNVEVDIEEKEQFLKKQQKILVDGFESEHKTYYEVICHRIKINKKPALLILPIKNQHEPNIVEIVSEENLRESLKLEDGDEVEIV
ncbi:MAG: CTP-dependent riboflavin kinase [Candidatus Woesearchaeota archaeon]|jgi:riboflavin kinase|nr:CTP-dependent riboflavin kinase [Candidatus Woesearchaeota archaeon]MDP7324030.1 CTP-dependent riboflavin kinase [Candidatus Woesearchaeota archaeon]MDP7457150.1 CTP-dependent riboflavin kinase [Candidatus Woesearchaeota archaeon]